MAPLPEAEWEKFASELETTKLSPGEAFFSYRESAERVGFLLKGIVKVFYLTRQGEESIRTFCLENSFAADLAALFQGKGTPSTVTIVALEPTEMITFDYDNFRKRLTDHWTWQQIGRLIAENFYLVRERRQFELLTMSAEERLSSFLTRFPGLATRISQKDLARYIGITAVSLSRLRGRLKS